ncbi:MarR family winged helix-turn-helix transcriptional regulator [Streptacidiphilus fuscans]|uniref:Winged helix-turn-helix transcriptional regulator n=1 Tax=Streptacidiphilus fuscans TaxID=2789292 RepID=A0A931B3F6_9ACTN|nr:MarR family winged helix-turn-helix transcriptional regulator [Streptacidiphilus fuscans]MBF9068587.1 winged helix-turn-helix transcriptional regulator [Streptacidiphilus fuscans]
MPVRPATDSLDTALRLTRAHNAMAKQLDAALANRHGVSYADFQILLHLGAAPNARLRRVDLAEALGLTASGVTRGLGPLERIGLVDREKDPRDARVAYAALTETGRALLVEMTVSAEEVAADWFTPNCSTAEVATLSALLGALGGGGRPQPGRAAGGSLDEQGDDEGRKRR